MSGRGPEGPDDDRPAAPDAATTDRADLVAELVHRCSLADRWGAVARARDLRRQGLEDRELREIIGAAVREVGRLWQSGRWTISQEHAATAVCEAVLTDLEAATAPPPPVGTVAVVAADGEWHAMPARLAAHAFERAGLAVRYLGAGVPPEDAARTLPSAGADVLAVSVTVTANLPGAARTIAAGRAAGLAVLLGGAASSPARAAALGADAHADDVEQGATLARAWCTEGPPPPVRATADLATAAAMRARRDRLRDAAYAATERRWPALGHAEHAVVDRVVEDLELHLDHLTAAVLVDEDAAYLELVTWLSDVHVGRGLPPAVLTAQLGALTEVLTDEPRLATLVDAADRAAGEPAGP